MLPRAFADNMALIRRYAMTRLQEVLPGTSGPALDVAHAYAAWERGFYDEARAHATRAGDALSGPEHAALRDALAKKTTPAPSAP
jgi:hypothetical protein